MDWWNILLTTSAVIAALGAAIGLIWKLTALIRRIESVLATDSQGKTAIDRTAERALKHDIQLQRIEYQLHPNGGGSLSDKVASIESDVAGLKSQGEMTVKLLTVLVEKE